MNFQLYDTKFGKFLLQPDDVIASTLKIDRLWEEELLLVFDKYLDRSSVVVEVGSFCGDHTVYLSKKCKTVYAFEGELTNFYHLISTLFLNDCYNVIPENRVIGNGEMVRLATDKDGDIWGWSRRYNASGGRFVVGGDRKAERLDDLNLPEIDLLKIDVEGMDLRVLKGASNLIDECHPLILFELNELVTADPFSEYEEFIASKNYSIENLSPGNYLATWREESHEENA